MPRWISNNSRFILYALANSSWILMTTLYRLVSPRINLSTCYSKGCYKGIAFYRALTAATHMYYRVSISSCGSVLFFVTFQLDAVAKWDSETRTMMFARDNYANSQDFEIFIQYSHDGESSRKSWRDIPTG